MSHAMRKLIFQYAKTRADQLHGYCAADQHMSTKCIWLMIVCLFYNLQCTCIYVIKKMCHIRLFCSNQAALWLVFVADIFVFSR